MQASSENSENHNPDEASSETSAAQILEGPVEPNGEPTLKPTEEKPSGPAFDPRTALYIIELERKVADFEKKIGDIRDYVKKMESEIEQIRARSNREQERAVDQQVIRFFRELLPALDNFELCMKSAAEEKGPLAAGFKMIFGQLQDFTKSSGLSRIKTSREKFDPYIHEAVVSKPVENAEEDGLIIEELKAGYKYKESVVRPAQVMVGTSP